MSTLLRARAIRRATGAAVAALAVAAGAASAQQSDRYILGEEKRLEMIVHVFGEVQRPGEYRVPDDTDVLQLVSKAGGPTEFAKLTGVTVTRLPARPGVAGATNGATAAGTGTSRILRVDLKDYLKDDGPASMPILQPGDVVLVPRNSLSKWKSVAGVIRDVSVVASAYFLYLRATKD
jgi:hypothetical protein